MVLSETLPVASTLSGIITAIATIITALGGLVLAFAVLIPLLRKTKEVERKIDGVHDIVNQQQTDLRNYQAALIRALKAGDIAIPIDQSAPPSNTDKEGQAYM